MRLWAVLLLALWAAALPARAEILRGVVFVVIDGDTVLFRPDAYRAASRAFLKIRLADIDAPEKDQPYGEAATRALADRVLNQTVEVEVVARDVYGRSVGRIEMNGRSVNTELVDLGLAWASRNGRIGADARSPSASTMEPRSKNALVQAEQNARRTRRGLWQEAAPIPPRQWRRERAAAGY